jgi:DNA-binding transcriptional ArsR family regulator
MGASKLKIFTSDEKEYALIGRAIAHPARIRIMNILKERPYVRNCELTTDLQLCKKSIHDHLKKLEEAALIKSEFFMNSLCITKNDGAEDRLLEFLKE